MAVAGPSVSNALVRTARHNLPPEHWPGGEAAPQHRLKYWTLASSVR